MARKKSLWVKVGPNSTRISTNLPGTNIRVSQTIPRASRSRLVRRKRGCLGYAPILVLTFLTAGLLRGISWKKRS
jgi:hypothetical protein